MKTWKQLMLVSVALARLASAFAQPIVGPPTGHYVEGELLVKFKGGPHGPAAERSRAAMKHEVKRYFDFIGWQFIRLPAGMTVDEGLARYREMPEVLAVEPNGIGQANEPGRAEAGFSPASAPGSLAPNDPQFSQQWALAKIDAASAWAITTGSTNVVVAVIDTGVNYKQEDLRDNMWRNPGEIPDNGIDDDGNGYVDDVYGIDTADDTFGNDSDPLDQGANGFYHGTACAGIIGAVVNNGKGIAGINWSVRIMALRALKVTDSISWADHIQAMDYIVLMKRRGVNLRVVSMSFGRAGQSNFSQGQKDAMDAVAAEGILQVAVAGNDGNDNDLVPFYPASHATSNLISVAASDTMDNLATFPNGTKSNFGRTNVDLSAPGLGLITTAGPETNAYETYFSGTSAATPLVGGSAALLFASNPSASGADVKMALLETVDVLPAFTNKMVSNGRLNVGRAILHPRVATGPPILISPPPAQTVILSNNVVLTVSSGGARPLHFQWLFNGVDLSDATNATLNLNGVTFNHAGNYRVVVTNAFGSVTSQVATLTVVPLLITAHPSGQNIRLTSNVTFSVAASGPAPLTYQWLFNGEDLPGATAATLHITNVQLAHEGSYSVRVSNSLGAVASSNAALVVLVNPVITQAPMSQSVVAGGSVTLGVSARGHPLPFGYLWRRGSTDLAFFTLNETNCFFTLTNVQPNQGGSSASNTYRVVITNLALPFLSANSTWNLTVLSDTDGDSLPDVWEAAYPNASDALADTDHDGLTNLQEYQAGTDPQDARSYLKIESLTLTNSATAAALRFFAISNKTYTVEARAAVDTGTWTHVADVLATATNRVVEVLDVAGPGQTNRYYRLRLN